MVKIADGSLTKVKGIGIVQISESLSLQSVSHVLNLSCNLVSISKLTKDLNCIANFHPNHCVFQDQCTGKKIGSAKEVDRLFLLEEKMQGDEIKKVYQAESSIAENKEVWLWHCRLGHPSFSYLKLLFPSLFKNKEFSI